MRGLYQDSLLLGDCSLEIGILDHQLRQQIYWRCIALFPSPLHLNDEIKTAVNWIKLTPGRRTEQLQLGLQLLWQWRCGGHLAVSDLSIHPTETGQKPHLFSTQPFLAEAADGLKLGILVHQHRPFLPGGGGNPGIGHREGMASLDGGGLLQQRIVRGYPTDR